MASIVVLVRHGKAQQRKADVPDFDRTLTKAGRRALIATLPDSLAPLAEMPEYQNGVTEIWSSSAYRSMETAEEIARVLNISKIIGQQSLFDQNFDAFIKEVREAEADVIVAVGHNPFMDEAAAQLCGVPVPFKTGGIGIFDISKYEDAPYDGTLRYFAQGPRTERWKTLVKMESILETASEKVDTNMKRYLENSEDVEAVHDFRVSIRTLRSQLAFIEPFQKADQNKRMQLELRDLVVQTSRLRELDVLGETIEASEYANEEVSNMCAKMRRKENNRLVKSIGVKKARKDVRKLLNKFDTIEWKNEIKHRGLDPDDIAARFELMALEFDVDYLRTDLRDVKATHKLRKDAKRVRYASRDFGELIGTAAEGVPKAMEDVQNELGTLCDARVNCDLLDSMPRKKLSEEADEAVAAMKQEQLDIIETILLCSEPDDGQQAANARSYENETDESVIGSIIDMPDHVLDDDLVDDIDDASFEAVNDMPDHVLEDEDDEHSDNIDAMFFGAPTAVADAALESKADSKAPQFSETEYIDMPERLSEDVDINMDIDEDYDQTETE